MTKPRRTQIFLEGGWLTEQQFVECVLAAIENAITDDSEGGNQKPASDDRRRIIGAALITQLQLRYCGG